MSDGKFFQTTKKGEIQEWKDELNSHNADKQKDAVKKVIAAMTTGKDVSPLFADVVKCVQTDNLELKKLVYLYIMNYAKSQPDLAILAVNTFVKDASDHNPLVRALAVRTMSCIRVDKITEYLAEPLRATLKDKDPYVRKTAAVAVAKLHDINPQLVEDQGFIDDLEELLTDGNPMVIANAVAALAEIQESSSHDILKLDHDLVSKLMVAVEDCTEWGQVFILDSVANYTARTPEEAKSLITRVQPRLQHANSAVVLSAVKVIVKNSELLDEETELRDILSILAPPLVTLLGSAPEIKYVALRNINLVVQKFPTVLAHEMKVFFCKYNDPIYVKMEKLEIMIQLANERNIEQVLMEFKEYAQEVDVEFVRKSVRAIGRCAIKLERAASRCVDTLMDLIKTKINYVVQEAVIVIKDIFRKYPNQYETIIGTLCENLDTLDEPEAKASMIWIIGEYAERIDNADELLDTFLDSFYDETPQVQLQILTAVVKLFLKRPEDTQEMVEKVLTMTTEESDNPDLRDRGYIYYRLLSEYPEAAKTIILAEKPPIFDDSSKIDESLLNELLGNLGTLAAVYHKPPALFVPDYKGGKRSTEREEDEEEEEEEEREYEINAADIVKANKEASTSAGGGAAGQIDLLGLDEILGTSVPPSQPQQGKVATGGTSSIEDFFGGGSAPAPTPAKQATSGIVIPKTLVLPAEKGAGMEIQAAFCRIDGKVVLDMTFTNKGETPLMGFDIVFNKNPYGLKHNGVLSSMVAQPLLPSQESACRLPCVCTETKAPAPKPGIIQVAVKNNVKVHYFAVRLHIQTTFSESGSLDKSEFLGIWRSIEDETEVSFDISNVSDTNCDHIQSKLEKNNIFFVARRNASDIQSNMYFSMQPESGEMILLEVVVQQGSPTVSCAIRSASLQYSAEIEECLTELLTK